MIASTGWSFKYFLRNLTDGLIHQQRASGMKKLPLIQILRFSFQVDFVFPSLIKPALIFSSFFIIAYFQRFCNSFPGSSPPLATLAARYGGKNETSNLRIAA